MESKTVTLGAVYSFVIAISAQGNNTCFDRVDIINFLFQDCQTLECEIYIEASENFLSRDIKL